jgi:type IV pilus assembly protein PilB
MKGYKGRIGIYEILEITESIRNLIVKRVSGQELTRVATEEGMISLIRDGLNKASGGMTTLEEVLRVVRE